MQQHTYIIYDLDDLIFRAAVDIIDEQEYSFFELIFFRNPGLEQVFQLLLDLVLKTELAVEVDVGS